MAYFSEDEESAESSQPEEEDSGEESDDRDQEATHLLDEQLERTTAQGMGAGFGEKLPPSIWPCEFTEFGPVAQCQSLPKLQVPLPSGTACDSPLFLTPTICLQAHRASVPCRPHRPCSGLSGRGKKDRTPGSPPQPPQPQQVLWVSWRGFLSFGLQLGVVAIFC